MKIKLQEAIDIDAKIKRLQFELMEALEAAESMGLCITQRTERNCSESFKYIISSLEVRIDAIEV